MVRRAGLSPESEDWIYPGAADSRTGRVNFIVGLVRLAALYSRMDTTDSRALLAEYVAQGSETAFRELVARYSGLVYGAALRQLRGDEQLAKEVTQSVFVDFARLARGLKPEVMLGGWLHRRASHLAATARRSEQRRKIRENEAAMRFDPEPSETDSARARPVLDEAIEQLAAADRQAILLRFFEGLELSAVGARLGTTGEAAQKRVSRALEKLRLGLRRRGRTLSVGALATLLAGEAATAAPAAWVGGVAGAALAGAAAQSGAWLTLIELMTMTKTNLVAAAIAVSLLVGTPWAIEHRAAGKWRAENRALRAQASRAEGNEALTYAGFATPEAAAQTFLWAMSQGDLGLVRACVEAEAWEQMRQEFEDKPEAEIATLLQAQARQAKRPPTRQKVYPDGRVVLALTAVDSIQGQIRAHDESLATFKKIGESWKIVRD
jgi:RNA polymerase sigma factor (sigma-70 family)